MFYENFNLFYFLDNINIDKNHLEKISFGNNLDFSYINFQKINIAKYDITIQDIFKFNLGLIIAQLNEYFLNTTIKIYYNKSNRNESLIKNCETSFKHDVYIQFENNLEYFDCGFDFIEKFNSIDNYKYISSQVNLDYYKYFDEEVDNLNLFMKETIYRLLIILCSLENDEYKLAEILFVKSNIKLDNLKEQLEILKKIIYTKKTGKINFTDFYEQIIPININNGLDMTIEEFQKYIQIDIFEENKLSLIDNKYLSSDDFEWIIMKLNSNISLRVDKYKMIYIQGINTLNTSLKIIIELVKQINKTKKYIPQYINNFLTEDLINYNDKKTLKNIYEKLDKYFNT